MTDQNHQDNINQALQSFQQDTTAFMNQKPQKMDASGTPTDGVTLFSEDNIADKDYITVRDAMRHAIYQREEVSPDRSAYEANDRAENLVDNFVHNNLNSMENANLRSASLSESPWSDDYWALYTGTLGKRYADPNFPESSNWKANFDYIRNNNPRDIFNSGNAAAIDLLSPSEKYDALVGDTNGTLTRRMWSDGKYYYEASGSVETWMGICHGWAPVAYMLDRPENAITVKAANGTPIRFYPSDIKALASLLWANVRTPTRFIGGRCNDKDPAQDSNGRITSSACFDTNPGTWHLSVVNQIGAAKRSMVLDATYDYEVWNQPIYAYDYRYFNPSTQNQVNSLSDATVSVNSFSNDPFSRYRSNRTKSVVGVAMRLAYVVETHPNQNTPDSATHDAIQKVDYMYDLELDSSDRIIGGEWYQNAHPDFLWTPPEGERAETRYDYLATGSWQQNRSVPQNWMIAAQQASSADGAPLAAIVERLIQFARR
uniref:Periplasmic beta-glucosidase (EC) n=1 Tax=uncultured Thiotrichaceae bacterium TaxID=298394 RepID=A0A6S6SAK6_9GAMM|nr:MAG: Periplasmic beta-glucosidase (EC [uncultured Thiotrichaceae bacterium]